eukprot:m.163095 g.163095  ORF g.163095 m.163095 type:complete len:1879 (-) comp31279_c0_seq2:255-5891(-)
MTEYMKILREDVDPSQLSESKGKSIRGGVWNRHLPYASSIDEEAKENFDSICKGLAEVVGHRLLQPGLKFWCSRLTDHIQLYKYSFTHKQHVHLIKTLFSLFWLDDLDPTLQERISNVLRRLIKKQDILPSDSLEIAWRPFYNLLTKYYFGKLRRSVAIHKQLCDSVVKLARDSRRFFPKEATSEILCQLRPFLCPHDETCFQAVAFLSLFLPTMGQSPAAASPHYLCWIDEMIGIWQWVNNSPDWDFAFFLLFSRVAYDNPGKLDGNPNIEWIFNRVLASLALPVGSASAAKPYQYSLPTNVMMLLPGSRSKLSKIAIMIVFMISPTNDVLEQLQSLLVSIEAFFHPSNTGAWTGRLGPLMYKLCEVFAMRIREESSSDCKVPPENRLTPAQCHKFVLMLKPLVFLAQFSKSQNMVSLAAWALRHLSYLAPSEILPALMDRVYPALQTLTETHQCYAALCALSAVVRPLLWGEHFSGGLKHLIPLLQLTLPGIDPNDANKTQVTLQFLLGVFMNVCLVDCSTQRAAICDTYADDEDTRSALLATSYFEDWSLQFMDRVFTVLETLVPASNKRRTTEGSLLEWIECLFCDLFRQISPSFYMTALNKLFRWISSNIIVHIGKTVGNVCCGAAVVNPEVALKVFIPFLTEQVLGLMAHHKTIEEADADGAEDKIDDELMWYLHILSRVIKDSGEAVIPYSDAIVQVLTRGLHLKWFKPAKFCGKMLRHLLCSLTCTYVTDNHTLNPSERQHWETDPLKVFNRRCNSPDITSTEELDVQWHIPTCPELEFAEQLTQLFYTPAVQTLTNFIEGSLAHDHSKLLGALMVVRNFVRVGPSLFPEDIDAGAHHLIASSKTYLAHLKLKLSADTDEVSKLRPSIVRMQRLQVCMHKFIAQLVTKSEDDTKLFKLTTKIVGHLLCVRGITEKKYSRHFRSWSYLKQGAADLVREGKRYSRVMLINRIALQHRRRMSKRRLCSPYTDEHQALVADLIMLGMNRYAIIRQYAQVQLSAATSIFPMVKDECFHATVKMLVVPEDQMVEKHQQIKGALYMLSTRLMARHVLIHWNYIATLAFSISGQHANERPSVQLLVNTLFSVYHREFRYNTFGARVSEDCFTSAQLLWPEISQLRPIFDGESLVDHTARVAQNFAEHNHLLGKLSELLKGAAVGWKFELLVAGILSLLLRESYPIPPAVITYFVRGLASDSIHMRSLAVKVTSLLLARFKHKPLKRELTCIIGEATPTFEVPPQPSGDFDPSLQQVPNYSVREDNSNHCFTPNKEARASSKEEHNKLIFVDKNFVAWNAWPMGGYKTYLPACEQPKPESNEDMDLAWNVLMEEGLFDAHIVFFSQDKGDGTVSQFSDVRAQIYKGLSRNHGPAIIKLVESRVQQLLTPCDTDGITETTAKHRCACELMGGVIRGAKHWSYDELTELWSFATTVLRKALYEATHTTIGDYEAMLRFCVYDRDPKRFYPLMDMVFAPQSLAVDEGDTSFAQYRFLEYHVTVLEELSWRGVEQAKALLTTIAPHISHPYKLVREKLARCLFVIYRAFWICRDERNPFGAEFIEGVRTTIMGARDTEDEAVRKESVLAAKTLLSWITLTYFEGSSPALEPYAAWLLPVVIISPELSPEDVELRGLCARALGFMAQTTMSPTHAAPLLLAATEMTKDESWHSKERALYFLQIYMFRNLFLVPAEPLLECMLRCLEDPQLEVKQLASVTLSGMLRCGLVDTSLHDRFLTLAKTKIRRKPRIRRTATTPKESPMTSDEKAAINLRHAGMLGLQAFVTAYPYTIPEWMPSTLVYVSECFGDPEPIKSCVKKTLSEFWRTHQDDRQALVEAFEVDQLAAVKDLVIGYNYYGEVSLCCDSMIVNLNAKISGARFRAVS